MTFRSSSNCSVGGGSSGLLAEGKPASVLRKPALRCFLQINSLALMPRKALDAPSVDTRRSALDPPTDDNGKAAKAILAVLDSCGKIFAHQLVEEMDAAADKAAWSKQKVLIDLRIATVSGAPHYVWTYPVAIFNALVDLGSRGALSFLPVTATDARFSLLGVKAPHPLLKTGAPSSVMHMLPLKIAKGKVGGGGRFSFASGGEGTSFDWWPAAAAPTAASKKPAAPAAAKASKKPAPPKAAAKASKKKPQLQRLLPQRSLQRSVLLRSLLSSRRCRTVILTAVTSAGATGIDGKNRSI